MVAPITNYLDDVTRFNTLEGLRARTVDILQDYGFNKFSYLGFNPPKTGSDRSLKSSLINSTLVQSTFPKDWIEHYDRNSFVYVDPMISNAKSSLLPFCWEGDDYIQGVTRPQKEVLQQGREFGIHRGVVIPVHAPGGEFATLAMATDESAEELQSIWRARRHELHLIGIYFHASVWENVLKRKIYPTPSLSPRELECLQWAARGKTLWEASQIMGIAQDTAKTHLKTAMRKLDTVNKTHAVSKALIHGLISL